jgi:putative hemolysin
MGQFWAEIILILLFIAGNGFFAAAEIALVSARRAPISALAQKGDRRALRVAALQDDPETFLATVQVGISLMTILAGVTGGAVFVQALARLFDAIPWPWLQRISAGAAFAVVTVSITYVSMVLGELVPKTITLKHPERWALRLVGPVYALSVMARPVVAALARSGRFFAGILGATNVKQATFITEEEVRWLVREGHSRGVFDRTERELITHVFSFNETLVRRAMTPRTDIAAIDRTWSTDRMLQFITSEGYSRYPVYEDSLDRVVGLIHTKDVINVLTTGGVVILEDLIRPPTFVPDSRKLGPLLRHMQKKHLHMAIVLDEFGGTAGLITLEDILEEIVGEIRDEHDVEAPEFSLEASGKARIAGKMPIDEFNEYFHTSLDEDTADTVGGYVTSVLGRLPKKGESVETGGVRFTVLAMDEMRIAWLEGERLTQPVREEDDD